MRKATSLFLCAALAVAFSGVASARGGGGGGGGMGGGMGGGFSHGSPVGSSSNSQSLENSNGRFAQDRDQGLDRAEDRMSTQGLEHEKASGANQSTRHDARSTEPQSKMSR
jgi:hypothetical protein